MSDKIDKLPQFKQDWANHIVYGGLLGFMMTGVAQITGIGHWSLFQGSLHFALIAVALVSFGKKFYDFFDEHESFAMCVEKAIITCLFPGMMFEVGRWVKMGILT